MQIHPSGCIYVRTLNPSYPLKTYQSDQSPLVMPIPKHAHIIVYMIESIGFNSTVRFLNYQRDRAAYTIEDENLDESTLIRPFTTFPGQIIHSVPFRDPQPVTNDPHPIYRPPLTREERQIPYQVPGYNLVTPNTSQACIYHIRLTRHESKPSRTWHISIYEHDRKHISTDRCIQPQENFTRPNPHLYWDVSPLVPRITGT